MNRFEGKVCLVTGGGSGIGKATCERLASEGGLIVVIDRDEEHAQTTAQGIKDKGGQAIVVRADVGCSADVQAAIQSAVHRWGKIDVIVNNAAMMTFNPIVDVSEEEWDQVQAVNLKSVFLFCKYGLPHMQRGAIVNISSVHAHETTPNVVPYAASKGGMEAFTRGVMEEIADAKVRVNCIAPGAINTPMLWNNPNVKSGKEKIVGAVGEPEDIAAAIAFLASDEARFINGAVLVVDGGRLDIL